MAPSQQSQLAEGFWDWVCQLSKLCRLIAKVSVNQDCRGDHGPEVDGCRQPGGDDLHPHGGGVVVEGGDVGGDGGAVPVGQGHHHVEGGQSEHDME